MSQISVHDISSLDGKSGPVISGITTVSSTGYMMVPAGPTEYRGGRGRGIFSAATAPADTTVVNIIEYITIATTGNASDFGDLINETRQATSGGSDSTRGLFSGGADPTNKNTISYITISATGNSFDFGDLSEVKRYTGSTSDRVRTVIAGGRNAPGSAAVRTVEFVTTQSLGNAAEFGELINATWAFVGSASSPTRGIYFGGSPGPSSDSTNIIEYVTIQTKGNAQDFGDLTNKVTYTGPGGIVSSTTRGIRGGGGGENPFIRVNTLDYITMASTGDAIDFGDLSYTANGVMGCSSLTRGIFAGGKTPAPASVNTIEYITIASTGDTTDFGDMLGTYAFGSSLSDAHGGLG